MSAREKILATIVGGTVFLLINLFLIDFFLGNHRRLRADMAAKALRVREMAKLLSEKELWEQRDGWLKQTQPRLANERVASNDLLKHVKEIADKHKVLISEQQFGEAKRRTHYVSVDVKQLITKSGWDNLLKFLIELQQPNQFIVFENANIEVDTEDKTQFKGTFRIARWFAL